MSNPHGSTPWAPGGGGVPPTDPLGAAPGTPEQGEERGLVNEPQQRTNIPIKIMIIALAALVLTMGAVGFLVTRTTNDTVAPDATPLAPEPTGPPVLPLQAAGLAREPGNASAPADFGVDRSILTSYANYRRNGEPAVIAVGARPVEDPKILLDQIKVRAQRQVGDGWCGREESNDLDVCILRRNRTAVLTIGLRDQTPEELIQVTQEILAGTT